jgi:hypothetical protein
MAKVLIMTEQELSEIIDQITSILTGGWLFNPSGISKSVILLGEII